MQFKGTHHVAVASKTSRPFTSCVSNLQLQDHSLHVGVGTGALYMLITCQEEMKRFNKTVEETENLVQELKQELQRNHEDSGSHHVHSAEDRNCPSQSSHADTDCPDQQPVPLRNPRVDKFLEEQVSATQGMAKDQLAALAAELEAELELMELNMKEEDSLPIETSIHDAGEASSKGGVSNSYYSDTSSHGNLEVSDIGRSSAQLEAPHVDYGVSAIELDHRLREVLEAQQQERILELEQLLEEAKAKLLAKEHEIFCWKNHVNSLTNLLQPHSTCGTHVTTCDNFMAAEPEVTKCPVELLQPFQDPPISTQINYLNATSSSNFVADACLHEMTTPQRNRACISASPFFKSSMDAMNRAIESECWLEGTCIDTPEYPEYVITKEIDPHTAGPSSEVFENKLGSSFLNAEGGDAASELEFLRLRCNVFDNDTPPGRNELEISELHHMKCRLDIESDWDSDVKYIVNSVMPKPIFLDKYHEHSGEEAMQESNRNVKYYNKGLQLLTEGIKETHGRSVEVTSPVLEKIRHYEALGGHARETNSRLDPTAHFYPKCKGI